MIGDGTPGPLNAITDVPGVRVGHTTLIQGAGPLVVGESPVRTGVTVVLPPGVRRCPPGQRQRRDDGLEWVRESGMLTSPVALTNTHSVGVVRDALPTDMVGGRGGAWGCRSSPRPGTACSTNATASTRGPSTFWRRSPTRARAPLGALAPAHERVGIVGELVDAIAEMPFPAWLIQPPRLMEEARRG